MTELGVNVDHVATVREAREIEIPDPVEAALIAERNGADGITIHLRKDRRHIHERDVEILRSVIKTRMNLEMAVTPEMIEFANQIQPEHITLVPEERDEVTTEGGLDVVGNVQSISTAIEELQTDSNQISLFVDPDINQLDASQECGADAVELHTGDYAETIPESDERMTAIERLKHGAEHAKDLNLRVHAGHGLNFRNVQPIASIEPVVELNIGHALIARSVIVGIAEATTKMKSLIKDVE